MELYPFSFLKIDFYFVTAPNHYDEKGVNPYWPKAEYDFLVACLTHHLNSSKPPKNLTHLHEQLSQKSFDILLDEMRASNIQAVRHQVNRMLLRLESEQRSIILTMINDLRKYRMHHKMAS